MTATNTTEEPKPKKDRAPHKRHGYTIRPGDLARKYDCSIQKILAFIASGELRAIDISERRDKNPRWVITPEAVEAFERARSSTAATTPASAGRRMPKEQRPEGFVDCFPEK
jgi:hypothetical protein